MGGRMTVTVRDVSGFRVTVMDQSNMVHKLSVTQSVASDEWKFTAGVLVSSLSLHNVLLGQATAYLHNS